MKKAILKQGSLNGNYTTALMTEKEKECYEKLRYSFNNYEKSISFVGLSIQQIDKVYQLLKKEEPELFFVEKISCQYVPLMNCGTVIPKYRFSANETKATMVALKKRINEIVAPVINKSDYEKEIYVHDFLCSNVIYDRSFKDSSFECVGPILFGRGVCEGISKAVKILFNYLNIEAMVVHGKTVNTNLTSSDDNAHAWNIVRIDGYYYHLDVTFDLTVMTFNVIRYDYFNLSTEDILIDHQFNATEVPNCEMKNDYYMCNKMFMKNQQMFKSYLDRKMKDGTKDIIIKLPVVLDVNRARDEILDIATKWINKHRLRLQLQLSYNESQRVFHLHIT